MVVQFDTQPNDLLQVTRLHHECHNQLLMSAMGQEVGSCGFTAMSFSGQVVKVGPELLYGLGFVYRVGIRFYILFHLSHTHSVL